MKSGGGPGSGLGGFFGLGLLGVGLSQISRPLGVTLAVVGAVRTIYTNVLGKGKEVSFPADTPIQLRSRRGPAPWGVTSRGGRLVLGAGLIVGAPSKDGKAPSYSGRLVVVHATVKNGRGELVTNLDQHAFTVFENGKRRSPSRCFVETSFGLAGPADRQQRQHARIGRGWRPALTFARASNPQDEMFVLNFADKAQIDVPLTGDLHVLEATVARVDSIGGTALRDAVAMAEAYLRDHATRDRKVLLVITDGNDNSISDHGRSRSEAGRGERHRHRCDRSVRRRRDVEGQDRPP